MNSPTRPGRGFTITEILVVIGVIVVLLGLLFPALAGIRKSGLMTKSMANMRQIGTWMRLYSQDNRDFIVPSQFNYDYAGGGYQGKVRSTAGIGEEHQGAWSDILWTVFEIGAFPQAATALGSDYRYDSPDVALYRFDPEAVADNPLRSAATNTRDTGNDLPTPYGCGASEMGLPGYFAANNFFAAPGTVNGCTGEDIAGEWYTNSQIRMPERSMYLVDSIAGETIEPEPEPYLYARPDSGPGDVGGVGRGGGGPDPGSPVEGHVDFRYSDMCLMLFLDTHVEPQGRWEEICDLEAPGGRGIRIRALTARSPDLCP
jgi:type II secretory pathway pseudopilin PulG